MFSRIRETIRIITYREPQNGADALIVERAEIAASPQGKFIARMLEVVPVIYILGYVAGSIGSHISKIVPPMHSASLTTIAGAVGVLLGLILQWVKEDVQEKIRARLNLADVLSPYFGHRLENTIRILKGSVRAS
jgi:hypothetical protein